MTSEVARRLGRQTSGSAPVRLPRSAACLHHRARPRPRQRRRPACGPASHARPLPAHRARRQRAAASAPGAHRHRRAACPVSCQKTWPTIRPHWPGSGDPVGQADSYVRLSGVFELQAIPPTHSPTPGGGHELFRTAGSPRGLAWTLNRIGWCHAMLGQPEQALAYCQQALTLGREVGDLR